MMPPTEEATPLVMCGVTFGRMVATLHRGVVLLVSRVTHRWHHRTGRMAAPYTECCWLVVRIVDKTTLVLVSANQIAKESVGTGRNVLTKDMAGVIRDRSLAPVLIIALPRDQ